MDNTIDIKLHKILGDAYHAANSPSVALDYSVTENFVQEAQDPAFKQAAQAKLNRLLVIADDRCHISKIQKRFLQRMLEKVAQEKMNA